MATLRLLLSKPDNGLRVNSESALVAQWIEQEPSNLLVAGSIPAEGTGFDELVPLGLAVDLVIADIGGVRSSKSPSHRPRGRRHAKT